MRLHYIYCHINIKKNVIRNIKTSYSSNGKDKDLSTKNYLFAFWNSTLGTNSLRTSRVCNLTLKIWESLQKWGHRWQNSGLKTFEHEKPTSYLVPRLSDLERKTHPVQNNALLHGWDLKFFKCFWALKH